MIDQKPFQEVLGDFVQRAYCSSGRLAHLTGLPRHTIISWLQGRVKKPHRWQDVVRIATALHLSKDEATLLLRSANHRSIEELRETVTTEIEQTLLTPWPRRSAPFQAIEDLSHFIGREAELAILEKTLLDDQAGAFISLEGMGGVGKTSLAAHVAYRLKPHFPDGVLWARMDTSDPFSTLSTFADAYGRDVRDYPDLDSRSRVVRELLTNKRVLVVLDNVERDEQVKPLLPATGHCAVIITTRRRDLWSVRSAYRLALRPFDPERQEALALFSQVLGEDVVNRNRTELVVITDLLGHLPLAVDIATNRLASEPDWTISSFLARLQQEQQRLVQLAYGGVNLHISFNLSYQALPLSCQQFFVSLGVLGGEDFTTEAAAHVAQMTLPDAEDRLRTLHHFCLIRHSRPGRWQMHPLLRDYALAQLDNNTP